MDGIDVALIRTDGKSCVERGANAFFAYDPDTRERLSHALVDAKLIGEDRAERPGCLSDVETLVTQMHADAVRQFLKRHSLQSQDVDLIGFHGQTVLHRPESAITVQLGIGQDLADETGIATVHDMRAADMIAGGQGAPLVPVYHQALTARVPEHFGSKGPVVFINIGGISNITYVDGDTLIAFDSGPGNALIDQWVQMHVGISHDQGGLVAAEGDVDEALVRSYLSDAYFEKAIPKSLDRNDFLLPEPINLSVETVARTLARVSAEAIFRAREHLPEKPALWIICGGGRHNPHIMDDIRELAANDGAEAIAAEEAGFDGDSMEAEAWAYLAVRSQVGLPLTYPQTTGCKKPTVGGIIASVTEL